MNTDWGINKYYKDAFTKKTIRPSVLSQNLLYFILNICMNRKTGRTSTWCICTCLDVDFDIFWPNSGHKKYFGQHVLYLKWKQRQMHTNISSVVEFQRWWVLTSKLFDQESTCHQGKIFKKFLRVMKVCQKVLKS